MSLSKSNPALKPLRHTAAALLGASIHSLFPAVQLLGSRENPVGFGYEVLGEDAIDPAALPLIEERMRMMINEKPEVTSREMLRTNAIAFFRHQKQFEKAELLEGSTDQLVGLLQIGHFTDLCALPHTTNLRDVSACRLLAVTNTERLFPNGDSVPVTHISAVVLPDNSALKAFIKRLDAHRKGDHRQAGEVLDLFTLGEAQTVLWHPKGACLRQLLLDWWQREFKLLGYQRVSTSSGDPTLPSKASLHAQLMGRSQPSYRELPVGYAESSPVASGEPEEGSGLLGLGQYTTAEGHYFCTPEAAEAAMASHLQFLQKSFKIFGLELRAYATVGTGGPREVRDQAWRWLQAALKAADVPYELDRDEPATLGPRVDLRIVDRLGREWLGPSVAFDLQGPEQHNLRYKDKLGAIHRMVMISCSAFGSLERWIALLLEQSAGQLPLWIAPEQVRLLPLTHRDPTYADRVRQACEAIGLRVGVDERDERLGVKVYAAERACVPYTVILGDDEAKQETVTYRSYSQRETSQTLTLKDFLDSLQSEVKSPTLVGNTSLLNP